LDKNVQKFWKLSETFRSTVLIDFAKVFWNSSEILSGFDSKQFFWGFRIYFSKRILRDVQK
jgi:hypothetical protein